MAREKRPAIPAGMKQARSRIERWRKTREKRTAMPEDLWSAAVALAKTHGVYKTSNALTVSFEALQKRIGQSPNKRNDGDARSADFVELDGTQLVGSSGTVVELSRGDGAKLTIRMPAGEDLDVASLAATFWSRGA